MQQHLSGRSMHQPSSPLMPRVGLHHVCPQSCLQPQHQIHAQPVTAVFHASHSCTNRLKSLAASRRPGTSTPCCSGKRRSTRCVCVGLGRLCLACAQACVHAVPLRLGFPLRRCEKGRSKSPAAGGPPAAAGGRPAGRAAAPPGAPSSPPPAAASSAAARGSPPPAAVAPPTAPRTPLTTLSRQHVTTATTIDH